MVFDLYIDILHPETNLIFAEHFLYEYIELCLLACFFFGFWFLMCMISKYDTDLE